MSASKTPLTNLRDGTQGGAPLFAGGCRLTSETPPTPPSFLDDTDPYLTDPRRRAMVQFVHIPAAGAASVDFVTLYARNKSPTERRYVNVVLAADLTVQTRITSPTADLTYGDVVQVEADDDTAQITASLDDTGAISINVASGGRYIYGQMPAVRFTPPLAGALSTSVVLDTSGAVLSVVVENATSHAYTSPPQVKLIGGSFKTYGAFAQMDEDTRVFASTTSGTLTCVGTVAKSQFANSMNAGDVILVNNEARVITSTSAETFQVAIDRPLTGTVSSFAEWVYLPSLSASKTSLLRIGAGRLSLEPSFGFVGVRCSAAHSLSAGDSIVYVSAAGAHRSHRVATIQGASTFTTDTSVALATSDAVEWRFVYMLSETAPGSSAPADVRVASMLRLPHAHGHAVDIAGLGGRRMLVQNVNFFGAHGSYYDAARAPTDRVALFATVANAHNARAEVPNDIAPENVLEAVIRPQPSPEVILLNGLPLNGGMATEVGKRPVVAIYDRAAVGVSADVTFWGHYVRATPASSTNYTQAINI